MHLTRPPDDIVRQFIHTSHLHCTVLSVHYKIINQLHPVAVIGIVV